MKNRIVLGQFSPGSSVIHKIDPRVKIILLIILLISIFLSINGVSLLINLISVFIFVIATKIQIKAYFKNMKVVFFVVLFTSILNLFYIKGTPIFHIGILEITKEGINNSIFVGLRLINLILISSLLTLTTSPTDLTYAIEKLLKPLCVFKIKTHELAMMMTISIRFIPTLFEETNKIIDAQKARGADMESGNFFCKIKAFIPVLIPLLVSSFKRAYDLATAMECRCYNGENKRTQMKVLHINIRDVFAMIIVLFVFILSVLSNILF